MMPSIKIVENILEKLSRIKEQCYGKLFGILRENTIFIIALLSDIESGPKLEESFPAELKLCGIFFSGNEVPQWKYVAETATPVLISCEIETGSLKLFVKDKLKLLEVDYDIITEQNVHDLFVTVRITGDFPLNSELSETAIANTFQRIRKSLSLGTIAFGFPKSNIILLDSASDNNVIGIDGQTDVGKVWKDSNSFNEESNKKIKIHKSTARSLEINALRLLTKHKNGSVNEHAPLCVLDKSQQTVVNMVIQVDALAMVHVETKLQNLYDILFRSVMKYIGLFQEKISTQIDYSKKSGNLALETYHFLPAQCGHFLTILYPKSDSDKSLRAYRHLLHRQLLLDFVTPAFRRGNKYCFSNNRDADSPLINPHEGIKPTDNGGTIALVKGTYEYYHYCQNKMDDDGWGCAYRSLQTLASWFKMQGYVDKEVPTFKEIQQCLVDIKDKPASFVGSRLWIGSTEVNFVLNTLLGVESKILYVSSGAEMASKGPELLHHFQTNGSPVMIGGGVLAHTILGVDYNQQTGNIRFLILDPHYTGSEDIQVVQKKGWCGWKNVTFWNKTAYYNMCLPQVSREI